MSLCGLLQVLRDASGATDQVEELTPKKPSVGGVGFPHSMTDRGVVELHVLTQGLRLRAVELDKMAEVLKSTGGVTMKQQQWLDRNVLHPVTAVNDNLDRIKGKMKRSFFEDLDALEALME